MLNVRVWMFTRTGLVALLACGFGACGKHTASHVDPNGPVEIVLPKHGVYTGAFMDFGEAEDEVTLEMIEDFEEMVGKHQAVIASSSYWRSEEHTSELQSLR